MIREDRDMKVVAMLSTKLDKPVLLLPLGIRGTNAGQANENMSRKHFFEATKLLGAYLFQVSYVFR